MEINRSNYLEIIAKSGLKPDKDYGQNYLLDTTICQRIVDLLDIQDEDKVLEIGPGLGSLTHFICLNEKAQIDLVDIDQRMIDFLRIIYTNKNVNFYTNDIRKHGVNEYTKVIGNLPYNITTEVIEYLVEESKNAKRMVLMCQAEAFDRINSLSGKEYGPISVLIHLLGICNRKLTVKPGSFYPSPKCNSAVFTIDFKEGADREFAINVYDLTKKLFLNRRKTIQNNLSSYLNDKDKTLEVLKKAGIDERKRPEEIKPEQFVTLYECANM